MILFIVETLDNEKDKELILMIYEKYAPWLRSRAYKITQDYEISNDLVHDCIINLIRHVDKLQGFNDIQLRAYLAIAIDNTSKNYIKHSSKVSLMSETEECFLYGVKDEEIDPEEIIEDKFRYEAVQQNIGKLSERDRTVIILRYSLDMTDKDIAPIIGISENSVRSILSRSVRRLGEKVKEVVGND